MMEMVLDTEALQNAVKGVREQYGKYTLRGLPLKRGGNVYMAYKVVHYINQFFA